MLKSLLYLTIGLIVFAAIVQIRAFQREAQFEASNPPEGRFVTVDGVRIHGVVRGTGPHLVVIHGASGNTRDITFDLVERLTTNYTVIVLDRPGLGHSDLGAPDHGRTWSGNYATLSQQADLLNKAAQAFGAQRPILLGHSYGGAVSLAWALDHPNDLSGLVLLGSVSNPWPTKLGWYYQVNGSTLGGALLPPLLTAFVPRQMITDTIEEIFAPQDAPENYATYVGPELVLRRESLRENVRQVNNLLSEIKVMVPRYGEIEVPTAIVHGLEDTIVPFTVHSEKLINQIPNASLTPLPDIGHMPHHADPQSTIAAINDVATRAGLR